MGGPGAKPGGDTRTAAQSWGVSREKAAGGSSHDAVVCGERGLVSGAGAGGLSRNPRGLKTRLAACRKRERQRRKKRIKGSSAIRRARRGRRERPAARCRGP